MSHCPLRYTIFDPSHSPDLNPCDYFIFPKLKNVLKERHFGALENVQKSVTDMLKTIPVEDFQGCYKKWKQRLHRCVAVQGNYSILKGKILMLKKIKTLVNKKIGPITFLPHLVSPSL